MNDKKIKPLNNQLLGMGFNPFHKRTINQTALAKMMLR
jgi:hypothetical protein